MFFRSLPPKGTFQHQDVLWILFWWKCRRQTMLSPSISHEWKLGDTQNLKTTSPGWHFNWKHTIAGHFSPPGMVPKDVREIEVHDQENRFALIRSHGSFYVLPSCYLWGSTPASINHNVKTHLPAKSLDHSYRRRCNMFNCVLWKEISHSEM